MPPTRADKTRKAFAQVLKEVRRRQEITQKEVSKRAGLHPNYASLLERAERQPTLDVILRLGKALSVAPEELVRRTSEELS